MSIPFLYTFRNVIFSTIITTINQCIEKINQNFLAVNLMFVYLNWSQLSSSCLSTPILQ